MVKIAVLPLILLNIAIGVSAQLSLKNGMNKVGYIRVTDLLSKNIFKVISETFVLLGIFLYIIDTGLWLVILSQEELSFAYPLLGLGYLITAVLAKLFLKESLTFFKLIGILLIISGAYLIIIRV